MIFDINLYLQCQSAMALQKTLLRNDASFYVRSAARTIIGGLFSYLAQMIISMTECATCHDL